MAKRKYVLVRQSMQSFIEPLPTDRLIWLAKAALDEIALRTAAAERAVKATTPKPREFQQHGRTLR